MDKSLKRTRSDDEDVDIFTCPETPIKKRVKVTAKKFQRKQPMLSQQNGLEDKIRALEEQLAKAQGKKKEKKPKKEKEKKKKREGMEPVGEESPACLKAVYTNRDGEPVELERWPHVHKLSPDAHKQRLHDAVELLLSHKIKITTKNIKKLGIGAGTYQKYKESVKHKIFNAKETEREAKAQEVAARVKASADIMNDSGPSSSDSEAEDSEDDLPLPPAPKLMREETFAGPDFDLEYPLTQVATLSEPLEDFVGVSLPGEWGPRALPYQEPRYSQCELEDIDVYIPLLPVPELAPLDPLPLCLQAGLYPTTTVSL
jgi:hypothetical protein